jgi:geranylgeranyl pyrophosphate synthase
MIHDWYDTYRGKVDSAIAEYFDKRYNSLVTTREKEFQEALRYAVEWNGKRIRVILSMIIYEELMGLPADVILNYLIGIELIHAYSLAHDDLPAMDNDELRRWELTVWKKYGETIGILVGDALQSMGIECIAEAKNSEAVLEITRAIGDMGMVRWQIRDIKEDHTNIDQKEIIRLHDEKTGKLFTASLLIGAYLAGARDSHILEQLRWFGVLLGRAFQVRDDILDYEGHQDVLGKATQKDAAKNKGIVAFMGIDRAKKLLSDLEYTLLEISNTFQTSKFADVIEYVVKREK